MAVLDLGEMDLGIFLRIAPGPVGHICGIVEAPGDDTATLGHCVLEGDVMEGMLEVLTAIIEFIAGLVGTAKVIGKLAVVEYVLNITLII